MTTDGLPGREKTSHHPVCEPVETLYDELSGLAGLHHRKYQRAAIVRKIKEMRS